MAHKTLILTTVVCTFLLFSCSDPKVEAEITQLKDANTQMIGKIDNVKQKLDSLGKATDSIYKNLSDLDMEK